MRILVYPHTLEIGGSQTNAIEIAAATRDLGHDVVVFGIPGALLGRITQLDLEFVESPPPGKRPSIRVAKALKELVDARGFDIVHGYEWPPVLDAVLASRRCAAAPVATVMSMAVPEFIPHSVPLVVGTPEIAAATASLGRRNVEVIEPPVDLRYNTASEEEALQFRRACGLNSELAVISVARLARELKLEGTLAAIDVVSRLSMELPLKLVLVGDGPAKHEVVEAIKSAERRYGTKAVVLYGQMADPRPAYAAADIVLGMGGSALRAMAFAKPLIVQGEQGFWESLAPESYQKFLWTGWYGIGGGVDEGSNELTRELEPLVASAAMRRDLGAFSRQLVVERFSLERAAQRQIEIYQEALSRTGGVRRGVSELSALAKYSHYYLKKRISRYRGSEREDDFNSRPITARNNGLRGGKAE